MSEREQAAAGVEARRRSIVVVVTVLATFAAFLDVTIVNVAFPAIEQSFPSTQLTTLSWVLNAYNIVFAALLLPAGRIGDVIGHRRVFFAGVLVFCLASAACGAAPSAELLILGRVLQAVGAALIMPSSIALLLHVFPDDRRAAAIAIAGAAAGVAAALGPSLGGVIVDGASWRAIFLVNVPIGLVVFALGRGSLPVARERPDAPLPDVLGTALLALAVGLLAFALVEAPDWGWTDGRVLAGFVGAAVLLPAFVLRARTHRAPAFDLSLVRIRGFAVANAATALFAAGFFAKILCDVLFLTTVWDYSVLTAGLALSPSPLITALTAGTAGRLASRFGHRAVVVPGALMYAAGCLFYAFALPAEPAYATRFLPMTVLTGVGIACALPMLTSASVASLPLDRLGVGSGANATARQLGGVLGIAALIAILGDTAAPSLASFHSGWTFVAACSVAAAVVASALEPDATPAAVAAGPPGRERDLAVTREA